jgi:Ca2+-binding RTX toxin-like protein
VAIVDLAGNDNTDALGIGPDGRIVVASLSFTQTGNDFDYRFAAARIDGTDVVPAAAITRTGTLLVQGSERDESIVLRDSEGIVTVSIDGLISTFPASAIKRIAVRAGGGRDEVNCFAEVGASIELSGENGNDRIVGNNRKNILRGGDGDDALFGGGGDDTIEGNAGHDTIEGGRGDDRLLAGGGADELFGNAGRDTLVGDISEDVLNGGAQ